MSSVEITREDLEDYLEAERSSMEDVYREEDVPEDPLLFLNDDLIPENIHASVVYENNFSGVVLPEGSTGSKLVPDNHDEDSWREVLETRKRESIRHELAHICYYNHHEDDLIAPLNGPNHPYTAHREALAMWEESRAAELVASFSLERYGVEGLEDIPGFWDRLVSRDDDVRTIGDPHRFGALSAYLVEQSYLQDNDLSEAKQRTQEDLLNVKSNKELEQVNRQAADRLSVPYFPDLIRGKNVDHMDTELGEKYLSDAKEML